MIGEEDRFTKDGDKPHLVEKEGGICEGEAVGEEQDTGEKSYGGEGNGGTGEGSSTFRI